MSLNSNNKHLIITTMSAKNIKLKNSTIDPGSIPLGTSLIINCKILSNRIKNHMKYAKIRSKINNIRIIIIQFIKMIITIISKISCLNSRNNLQTLMKSLINSPCFYNGTQLTQKSNY
jgi:hypothetical protein